jgi:ribosome maturation factor RimP
MIEPLLVTKIVEKALEGKDLFLVKVNISRDNVIEVIVDSDNDVSIDNCMEISREIEGHLNRDEEDYELTVASAGLSSPLFTPRQYKKHLGKMIEITGKDGRRRKVQLLKIAEGHILIEEEKKEKIAGTKKKQIIKDQIELAYDQIKLARAVIDF